MFCAYCGEPILGASGFCHGCGARISAAPLGMDARTRPAGLLRRIENIVVAPATEWPFIASESASPRELYVGYVAPLAAIGVVASFVGRLLLASPAERLGTALVHAILSYVLCFLGVSLVALIVDLLAPRFGGRRDAPAALRLIAYGFTPGWIAAAFNLVPALNVLSVLGAVYGAYVVYRGLPVLMRCPIAKAGGYAVVALLCAIATWAVLAALAMCGAAGIDVLVGDSAPRMGA